MQNDRLESTLDDPAPEPVKDLSWNQFVGWLVQMNEITTACHKVAFSADYYDIPDHDSLTDEETREVLSDAIDAICAHALTLSRRVVNLPDNWGDHLTA